jgi:hypothetical protein
MARSYLIFGDSVSSGGAAERGAIELPSVVTQGTAFGGAGRHSVIAGERKRRFEPGRQRRSTMTSNAQNAENAENSPLDDYELELVRGGFFLMEELVQINQVAIIMGMQVPAVQKVR